MDRRTVSPPIRTTDCPTPPGERPCFPPLRAGSAGQLDPCRGAGALFGSRYKNGPVDGQRATGYTTAQDGVSLVFQLSGAGTTNLVWLPSVNHPIDLLWE